MKRTSIEDAMKTAAHHTFALVWIALLALCLFVVPSPNVMAGESSGTVQIQLVYSPNRVFFFTSHRRDAWPACASTLKRWVLDISHPDGRARYALLLSAQVTGKPIYVWGTGDCLLWSDSETAIIVGFEVDPSQVQ
jgi:hypothetical protein